METSAMERTGRLWLESGCGGDTERRANHLPMTRDPEVKTKKGAQTSNDEGRMTWLMMLIPEGERRVPRTRQKARGWRTMRRGTGPTVRQKRRWL